MVLAPVCACREFVGCGKIKASEVVDDATGFMAAALRTCAEDEDIWAVMKWTRYEDGHEEPGIIN